MHFPANFLWSLIYIRQEKPEKQNNTQETLLKSYKTEIKIHVNPKLA